MRLRGGPETSYMREGRVEIYLGNKGWFGTCDKEWGIEEAIVVCRQLGYPGAIRGTPNYSTSVGTVLLSREWRCTGSKLSFFLLLLGRFEEKGRGAGGGGKGESG